MTELIEDKKEIDKIIKERIKDKRIVFTTHYKISSAEKGIEDKKVKEIFQQFDKVYAIEKDTLNMEILVTNYFTKLAMIQISQ